MVIETAARRRSASRLRLRPDGARSANRQVPPHAAVRADARLQPEVRPLAGVPLQRAASGPSCTRKHFAGSAERRASWCSIICAKACSRPTSTIPLLNPLYRDVLQHYGVRRAALPRARSGPQGQGRVRRRPCPEDAAERAALRKSGRSASVPGSMGRALGRHAHSRHHQTAGRGDVRRRATGAAALAAGALSLLPIRRTHRASGWLRRSRSGLLRRAAGLDRPPRSGAVE